MNTLSRNTTTRFFADVAHYDAMRRRWSILLQSNDRFHLDSAHHLLYLALRGRDWRRGWTPIRNQRKLTNGAFLGWQLFNALWRLHNPGYEDWLLAPFDGLVTPAMLATLRPFLPHPNPYQLDAQLVARSGLPFDAYEKPEELKRD